MENQRFPKGRSHWMRVKNVNSGGILTEQVGMQLNGMDISTHSPVERARLTVKYWNDTLRSHDSPRELVDVYAVDVMITKLDDSDLDE